MGGDGQPQILLQLLARTLVCGHDAGAAIEAPRWVLAREGASSFRVWHGDGEPLVRLEQGAPAAWSGGLRRRGYEVAAGGHGEHTFGHAQMIRVSDAGVLSGAADPRSGSGALVGL